MPVTVTMPPVSEAAAEATVGAWLRQPGDAVVEGEPLLEIVSDKVTLEVPAPASGVLGAIAVQEGETAAVGAPIATIVLPGEADPRPAAPRPTVPAAPPTPSPATPSAISPPPAAPAKPAVPAGNGTDIDGRRLYTPRVRQLAAEHGLSEAELAGLRGSGLGGRLTSEDLLAYLAQRPAPAATAVAAPSAPPAAAPPPAPAPAEEEMLQPLTPIRRAIAAHMERSVQAAPHGWMSVEIDMSAVSRARAALRPTFEAAEGFSLTFLPFFASAVAGALRAVPALNATWEGDALRVRSEVNLGIAVAIEGGLVVPVIAGADGLNLTGLARAIRDRVERARANRLTPADMSGGTCTVNNTGAVGSILSRPIINQPQVAIVTMEAIVRRPVVVGEDAIAIRPLMNACLSYDERAVDPDLAGRFLAALRQRLEAWDAG
jgi:2-oxoisovalerate dehydrogenase E2 component (dihydrolipoyl transacylase)